MSLEGIKAVIEQLMEGPKWAGNIVCKTSLKALRKAGVVRYDPKAQDKDPSVKHMPGAYVLNDLKGIDDADSREMEEL